MQYGKATSVSDFIRKEHELFQDQAIKTLNDPSFLARINIGIS